MSALTSDSSTGTCGFRHAVGPCRDIKLRLTGCHRGWFKGVIVDFHRFGAAHAFCRARSTEAHALHHLEYLVDAMQAECRLNDDYLRCSLFNALLYLR